MTTKKIALDYLAKVRVRLMALRLFLEHQRYDDVMREAQEAVELLVKGALRFVGIDPPRRHEPAALLLEHIDRFPASWRARAEEIRGLSERLFSERGLSFYGDEDDLLPPSELFERGEAEAAIADVERLLALYEELVTPAAP